MIKQEQNSHFLKFIFVALLVHVFLYFNFRDSKFKLTRIEKTHKIEIDLKNSSLKKKIEKKAENKNNLANNKKSLNDFLPKTKNWTDQIIKSKPFKSEKEFFTQNFKDSHFDLLIWEKIDKVLYYPEIFNYFLIDGNISAEISIKHDGSLANLPYIKNQGNKHLEQFLLKQLKKAFETPLSINRIGKLGSIYNYKLNFKFYISYKPDEVVDYQSIKSENKNLNFFRKAFNFKKSPLEKHLPFFMGGGSQINFIKAYEKLSGREKVIRQQKENELEHFLNKNQS